MRFTVRFPIALLLEGLGIALLVSLVLALSGCGGGGDGKVVQPPSIIQSPEPTPPENLQLEDVQALAPEQVLDVAQEAAISMPKFGSVVQSAGTILADVNTAAVEFDRGQMAVTVTRQGGRTLTLDSRTDAIKTEDGFWHGYAHRGWGLLRVSGNSATIAATVAEWSPNDYGDWIAGGVWLHFTGNLWRTPATVTGAEIGAFVDGPELDGSPTLPSLGIAAYNGVAAGFFAARYGNEYAGTILPPGTVGIGAYEGALRLTADFGTESISGKVDSIEISGVYETPRGDLLELSGPSASELHLGAAGFTDGRFTGGVTVTSTDPRFVVVNSSGSWGGKFSTIDDGDGNPRLVAGTHGGRATTLGGSQSVFVGMFNGATGQRGLTPHE